MFCSIHSSAEDYDRRHALKTINQVREDMGIKPLEKNSKLEQAANTHSKYMSVNNSFSLIEENGNHYYRGRYSWDRASYFYYSNPFITEFIHNQLDSIQQGIQDFMNNPYSRVTFLDPLYEHIGMGNYKDMYTYDLGGQSRDISGDKLLAVYPYDQMEDVPISWENNYKIDPYRQVDGVKGAVGVPITITYYSASKKIKTMDVQDVSLVNTTDHQSVKTEVILPQDDKYLTNTLMILPLEALDLETTYALTLNADFTFRNGYAKVDKHNKIEVHFSTEKRDIPLTRGILVEHLVKDLDYELLIPNTMFEDIDKESELAKYIYTAYHNSLINGYHDNTFRPNVNITKEQVYTVLIRALEKRIGQNKLDIKKSNVRFYHASSWAVVYLNKAYAIGLVSEDSSVNFTEGISLKEYKEVMKNFLEIYRQYGAFPRFVY